MKSLNSGDVRRMLEDDGWVHVGTKGDHWQFKNPVKPGRVTITHPVRDIPTGTLRSIYRQAGWNWKDRK
jgi:predicted RNA binding protein YcfA (HicA-like mRNA interferase family)